MALKTVLENCFHIFPWFRTCPNINFSVKQGSEPIRSKEQAWVAAIFSPFLINSNLWRQFLQKTIGHNSMIFGINIEYIVSNRLV